MKKILKGFLIFLGGFMLMGTIHLVSQCESFNDIIDPPDDIVDDKGVKASAKIIEDAFLKGDIESIKENLLPETVEYYSSILESSPVEDLVAFGEAFKSRELDVLSGLYAEYNFSVNGKDYSVTFALQDGDKWVLSRF